VSKREKTELKPYATPLEWLEGRRRVDVPLPSCGEEDWFGEDDPMRFNRKVYTPPVMKAIRNWREETHRRREELTRQAGVVLPLDEFVARHSLDAVARDIIEILLLEATNIEDPMRMYDDVSKVVRRLVRGRDLKTEALLPYLLPGSRLRRLVGDPEPRGLTLRDELVLELLGIECDEEPAAPEGKAGGERPGRTAQPGE